MRRGQGVSKAQMKLRSGIGAGLLAKKFRLEAPFTSRQRSSARPIENMIKYPCLPIGLHAPTALLRAERTLAFQPWQAIRVCLPVT